MFKTVEELEKHYIVELEKDALKLKGAIKQGKYALNNLYLKIEALKSGKYRNMINGGNPNE